MFSHYVICNDTQETLRFGQVDTDENVLLSCVNSHQYSWRSHKSPQVPQHQGSQHGERERAGGSWGVGSRAGGVMGWGRQAFDSSLFRFRFKALYTIDSLHTVSPKLGD